MLSERIKILREAHRMTQAELARRLGISRAGVNSWEMGLSMPSTSYIAALAQLFQVSADYLLGLNNTSSIPTDGLTEEDMHMVYALVHHLRQKNQ